MNIGKMIAAAAVAAGIGSVAEASTVVDYDLYLRYEGTSFIDFWAFNQSSDQEHAVSSYPVEDPLGLDVPNKKFPGLAVGDIVRFIATVIFPDNPNQVITQYGNGGSAPICSIGKVSCTNTEYTYLQSIHGGDGFVLNYSDTIGITGNDQVGSTLTYSHYYTGHWSSDDSQWSYYAWDSHAKFTVVRIVDTPAPVPLPATAALLPMGIGALALMRRRRRSA